MSVAEPLPRRRRPAIGTPRRVDHQTASVPDAASPRRSWHRLLPLLGLAAWGYGVSCLSPQSVGGFGMFDSGRGGAFVAGGLALLLLGLVIEIARGARTSVLVLNLIGLIVAIHATVPLVFGAPEYAWVYKHVGVAAALQQNGRVIDPTDIYQEWPAFFAALASISSLAHTNPLTFARWAPLAFELGDALVLIAIMRLLIRNRRITWLAITFYEGFIAWVGQDYLSPQAFTYLLWLGMLYVVLRWLRHDPDCVLPDGVHRGPVRRIRGRLLTGIAPAPQSSRRARALASGLVLVMFFVITAAHQLTPYMILIAILALTVLDLVRPRWLVLALAAIAAGYLALHYSLISAQYGGLFSGGSPLANATGVKGTARASDVARLTSHGVIVLAAIMWVGTALTVVAHRRRLGTVILPALLAFSPFVILLGQSYGGEAIYRVFMFSCPGCAVVLATGLSRLPAKRRWLAAGVAAMAVFACGIQGLYGVARADAFTPAEVAAGQWIYHTLPSGSLIVLPVDNFPIMDSSRYEDYDVQTMPADPQLGVAWLDEDNIAQVNTWLKGLGHRSAYVVVSAGMNEWIHYYASPTGYPAFARYLASDTHAAVVFHDASATIYRLTIKGVK